MNKINNHYLLRVYVRLCMQVVARTVEQHLSLIRHSLTHFRCYNGAKHAPPPHFCHNGALTFVLLIFSIVSMSWFTFAIVSILCCGPLTCLLLPMPLGL